MQYLKAHIIVSKSVQLPRILTHNHLPPLNSLSPHLKLKNINSEHEQITLWAISLENRWHSIWSTISLEYWVLWILIHGVSKYSIKLIHLDRWCDPRVNNKPCLGQIKDIRFQFALLGFIFTPGHKYICEILFPIWDKYFCNLRQLILASWDNYI